MLIEKNINHILSLTLLIGKVLIIPIYYESLRMSGSVASFKLFKYN